ncbi:MAG TPA: ABC transporter permease subunit [Nitrososphaerales archaeon]|nr:ABC transporter permease subunit [Nitrososphaerales archaeon]
MILALGLSIMFSLFIGILAARNKRAESLIIPLLDVFQSIPILAFFPLVIGAVTAAISGQAGISLAVVFLIFTSMSWNIAFGVYEAVKSIPKDYIDLAEMSGSSSLQKIKSLYIPASLSRIAYNTQTSWAVGLFYLISSEIFSTGAVNKQVSHGIGVDIVTFYVNGDFNGYVYSILLLLVAVAIWQVVFLREFSLFSERYKFLEEPRGAHQDPLLRFYGWVNDKSISKLFLLSHVGGVNRVSSVLFRFRKGILYAAIIAFGIFAAFEFSTFVPGLASGIEHLSSAAILSAEGTVLVSLGYSFVRIWSVYFLAVAVGLPIGIGVALRTRLYEAMVPLLEVVASIPAPALLPFIAAAAMEQGEIVAAFIIFVGMIWYIIFNVMAGIRTLPAEIFELKKVFQLSSWQAWRQIYIPASTSAFVTGSITAIGAAWNTLIVAEIFQVVTKNGVHTLTKVGNGIGLLLVQVNNANPYTATDAATFILALVSMTVLIIGFNLLVWRRVYHRVTKRYAYNR